MQNRSARGSLVITTLAGLLFLAPWILPAAFAQSEDKDASIKMLKEKIELQQKEFAFKLKDLELFQKQQLLQSKRLIDEVAFLTETIKNREMAIVRLAADVKKYHIEAVQYEALARQRGIQIENLLEQLRGKTGGGVIVEKPNSPLVLVNGKVEKIYGDLVQISLGTEHGINKNHTLHVYRLQPEPKYLGMIRLVDANHFQSVARPIPTRGVPARPMLRVGDLVTSRLTEEEPEKEKPAPEKEKEEPKKK